MTVDKAIELLTRVREKHGGWLTLWVAPDGVTDKWDEEKVKRMTFADDGESCYVRIETAREGG